MCDNAQPQVSVAIVTYDRPDDLRECLASLIAQEVPFPFEIIVVDNHPSGMSAAVVADMPLVRYIKGPGRGSCSGRNAALRASRSDIILWANDDCIVPPGWIAQLSAQFTRPEIAVVCGNVLPYRVETEAERLFAKYNTTVRGSERIEYTHTWLDQYRIKSPPTQYIGVGANFATRVAALHDPRVGGFNEVLGAGTPVGSADDQYLWYRVLRAGYTIVYEPSIEMHDKFEDTIAKMERKLFNYGKAMIGYEMELLVRDRDLRGLIQLMILPTRHIRRLTRIIISKVLTGRMPENTVMYLAGTRGNLVGFPSWLAARRNVRMMLGSVPKNYARPDVQPHTSSRAVL
jgi:O-antigen biosynthesis protein